MTMLNGQPIGDPAPKATVTPPPSPTAAAPGPLDSSTFLLSVMALIFAFTIPVVGAIMGGIALAQSRRAGQPNTIARAAFWVGLGLSILIVLITVASVVIYVLLGVGLFNEISSVCNQGDGTYQSNGVTYTCS